MRVTISIVSIVIGFGLTACSAVPGDPGFAGHPLDCAVGFMHADCQPGTAGYQAIENSRAAAQAQTANDDAYCRSLGVSPGSDGYVQCRMNLDNQRMANKRAVVSAILARPTPQPPSLPQTTHCTYGGTTIGGNTSGMMTCN
jgi:hypothetical protein